jgi:hypothetical protein
VPISCSALSFITAGDNEGAPSYSNLKTQSVKHKAHDVKAEWAAARRSLDEARFVKMKPPPKKPNLMRHTAWIHSK